MNRPELQALYVQYSYLVHRRCLRLLASAADADDTLQEVFVRVQRYGRPAATGSDLGWLYSIAEHCCFDLLAKRQRERPATGTGPGPRAEASVGDAADGDRRAVLGAALASFDDQTRRIGVLYFLGGFTQDEVATETGYSRRTVGKKLALFEHELRRLWSLAQ